MNDVSVVVSTLAERFTGGHQHDANRPNARVRLDNTTGPGVSSITQSTGATGQVTVELVAPEISGTYEIKAECPPPQLGCLPPEQPHEVDVRVPDLAAIPFSLWYAFVGQTTSHPSNHFLTAEASVILEDIVVQYNIFHATVLGYPPDLVRVNDASLQWGGVFDLAQNWQGTSQAGGHAEHRFGTVVDIRGNGEVGAIPLLMQPEFLEIVRDNGGSAAIHSELTPNQHIHTRLAGRWE